MEFNVSSLLNYTIDDGGFLPLLNLFQNAVKEEIKLVEESRELRSKIPMLPSSSYALLLEEERALNSKIALYIFAIEIRKKLDMIKDIPDSKSLDQIILKNKSLADFLKWISESETYSEFIKDLQFNSLLFETLPLIIQKHFFEPQTPVWHEIKARTGFPIETTEGGRPDLDGKETKNDELMDFLVGFTGIVGELGKMGIQVIGGKEFWGLKVGVRFHFLGEQQTNRIDKPDWMFAYVEDLVGMNVGHLREMLLEEEVTIVLGRRILESLFEEIEMRFQNDYESLKNNDLALLHFIDSLNRFENNMGRLLPPPPCTLPHPSLLERILLLQPSAFTQLLSCELSLFNQKIFSVSASSSSLTSLIENYCVLYKKLYQKYDLISNSDFLSQIQDLYLTQIFQNLLTLLSNQLSNTSLDQLYQAIVALKNFYKGLPSSTSFSAELLLLRDFKHSQIHAKTSQISLKAAKNLIKLSKNIFKQFFAGEGVGLISSFRSGVAKEIKEIRLINSILGIKLKKELLGSFWQVWMEEIVLKVKWNERGVGFGVEVFEVVVEEVRKVGEREGGEGVAGKMREVAEVLRGGKGEGLNEEERKMVGKAYVMKG